MEENYKDCISCGQSILTEAKICKYCRREQHQMSVQPEVKISGETKKCIHCAELIALEAKLCKHCRKWQVDEEEQKRKEEDEANEAAKRYGCGCLGFMLVLLALMYFTTPNAESMRQEIAEDAVEQVMSKVKGGASLIFGDASNAVVDFFGGFAKEEMKKEFLQVNDIQVDEGWFWSRAYIYNSKYPGGKSVGLGFLGMTFLSLDWSDFQIPQKGSKSHGIDSVDSVDTVPPIYDTIPEAVQTMPYDEAEVFEAEEPLAVDTAIAVY